jgi:hypothetical protein
MDGASDEESRKGQEINEKLQLPYDNSLSAEKLLELRNKFPFPLNQLIKYFGEDLVEEIKNAENQKVREITKNIQLAREKLQKSSAYKEIMEQMQNPEMVARIKNVIDTDPHHSQLQLVLYGVGEMKHEIGALQLAFAILLREKFEWVNDIVVFDPILSPLETRAICELNCTYLFVNEEGRRTVDRPTLFFMPHCPVNLFENVLQANWTSANLNKIIILGNILSGYIISLDYFFALKAVLNTDHVLHEIPLPEKARKAYPPAPRGTVPDPDREISRAFLNLGWHFFAWDDSLEHFKHDFVSVVQNYY